MSVSVKDITKIYGTQKALDSVSFDINPGEVVGLLGPNGAGKSTIMKIVTCFIPPTSGDAKVCGFDILDQSLEVRKKTGYLPENNPLYPDMYVREFLNFIAGLHASSNIPASRINDLIGITGLSSEQHKKIGSLSKGFKQRVGLARALLHDPEVLILDEPTSGLDPNQLLEIRSLIKETGKQKTIVLSTHIMQEVEAICDRVIIIHKGKIVADDSTANIQNLPSKNMVIIEFDKNVAATQMKSIPGVKDAVAINPAEQGTSTAWHLTSAGGADIRPAVFQFAVEKKLTVLSMRKEEISLEEVFQELTKN